MGLAPTGYRHTEEYPIYGTGQGSANSPAIWCFLSSTLFDCYNKKAHKTFYFNPTGSVSVELVGMVDFVDDCNGQTNLFRKDPTSQTIQR